MRRFPIELLVALAVTSCNSNVHFLGSPVNPPLADASAIRATMTNVAEGLEVTIADPSLLPPAVRAASYLQVAFGTTLVTVARRPNGAYSFVIPPGVSLSRDVNGVLTVVFVMDRKGSQIVKLATGSPLVFGKPAIVTVPGSGVIARGQDTTLQANTDASTDQYDFTWSVSTSAYGPWQPIPGDGKVVKWTPLLAGNYYVTVSATERSTHRVYTTTSPEAVVFVTDTEDVVTTEPQTGSIVRGSSITLKFNPPSGLDTAEASYSWSAGPSAQGPWTSIPGARSTLQWTPTAAAEYFVRVDVSSPGLAGVNSFVSPLPAVYVYESQPLITASATTVERGVPTLLTLNVPGVGPGPFNWYFAILTGGPLIWVPAGTGGAAFPFVPTDVGNYVFRVDLPQPDGSIKTFVSPEPTLSVVETVPIVTAYPMSAPLGASVLLTTHVPSPGAPLSWYYLCRDAVAPNAGLGAPTWVALDGIGPTVPFSPPTPGLYTFRVDVPQPDGTVKVFINTQPALTVTSVAPVILASKQVIERGDAILINLTAAVPAGVPISWFITTSQPSVLVPTSWTPLPGTGNPLPLVLPTGGSYYFRADVPGPNGTLQTFMNSHAAVTVVETTPVLHSLPANAIVPLGGSTRLFLDASGLPESGHRFDWYVATSALGPWSPLPATSPHDKRYTWQVPTDQIPAPYFVRVVATQVGGPTSYDFVSNGPVVTIVAP